MKSAALVLALALTGLPTLAEDSPGLDRLDTREDLRGFEPVGRVDVDDGGFCTGALIAPDLVLTAAHCVIGPDGTPVAAATITFRAGLTDGVALADSRVRATVVHPDYRWIDPSPAEQIRIDVALLQLATPIPTSLMSPFAVALPGPGDEVSVVSYADGREEALSWQRACNVLGREAGLIAVDCDVTYGSSGAPVLDRSHYRARIVSIISAGYTEDGMRVTWGMELPDLVARLKADLRAGRVTSLASDVGPEGAPASGTLRNGSGTVGKRIIPGGGAGDTGARFVTP